MLDLDRRYKVHRLAGETGFTTVNVITLRLQNALENGGQLEGGDAVFYLHELAEGHLMQEYTYDEYQAAHELALEKYGVNRYAVYDHGVVIRLPGYFSSGWRQFWQGLLGE